MMMMMMVTASLQLILPNAPEGLREGVPTHPHMLLAGRKAHLTAALQIRSRSPVAAPRPGRALCGGREPAGLPRPSPSLGAGPAAAAGSRALVERCSVGAKQQ